jgi:hypothetical protein
MAKTELSSHDQAILQRTHEKSWKAVGLGQAEQVNQGQLWNFEGIPSYIKGYL